MTELPVWGLKTDKMFILSAYREKSVIFFSTFKKILSWQNLLLTIKLKKKNQIKSSLKFEQQDRPCLGGGGVWQPVILSHKQLHLEGVCLSIIFYSFASVQDKILP